MEMETLIWRAVSRWLASPDAEWGAKVGNESEQRYADRLHAGAVGDPSKWPRILWLRLSYPNVEESRMAIWTNEDFLNMILSIHGLDANDVLS
jgi:hypothetical protein